MEWYVYPALLLLVVVAFALKMYLKSKRTDKSDENTSHKSQSKKNAKSKRGSKQKIDEDETPKP